MKRIPGSIHRERPKSGETLQIVITYQVQIQVGSMEEAA
ncbi:MAG: hypothetical protein H6Q69_3995 [Firmicutes bacterium]|jgi:hypothetical protein|nr:hypothetical protein [Bacillota bacterium]